MHGSAPGPCKKAAMQHSSFRHLRFLANERYLTTFSSYAPMFGWFAIASSALPCFTKEIKNKSLTFLSAGLHSKKIEEKKQRMHNTKAGLCLCWIFSLFSLRSQWVFTHSTSTFHFDNESNFPSHYTFHNTLQTVSVVTSLSLMKLPYEISWQSWPKTKTSNQKKGIRLFKK